MTDAEALTARAQSILLIPHTQQRRAYLEGIEATEGKAVADALRAEILRLWKAKETAND